MTLRCVSSSDSPAAARLAALRLEEPVLEGRAEVVMGDSMQQGRSAVQRVRTINTDRGTQSIGASVHCVPQVLDIVALRSLVAVADHGGFHRAAAGLGLSQSTVSQHVRRLELAVSLPLVEREGRGSRFTAHGETLVAEGRRILAAHDEALARLSVQPEQRPLLVGATEHGADRILPRIAEALRARYVDVPVTFRIDRSSRLHELVDRGTMDVAIFLGDPQHRRSRTAGDLTLRWFSSPDFVVPSAGRPWPLAVIDEPCTIRRAALSTLAQQGVPARVVAEAGYLAGVVNSARAGIAVALLADIGAPPEGLVRRADLPTVAAERLRVRVRSGADADLSATVATTVQTLLAAG
ncbi:LysR family transcriptional regulator [Acidothermaceae bacterium B102]|nr:LysR family transcriptional regulator [Acidothermaceae bacterium B102]